MDLAIAFDASASAAEIVSFLNASWRPPSRTDASFAGSSSARFPQAGEPASGQLLASFNVGSTNRWTGHQSTVRDAIRCAVN